MRLRYTEPTNATTEDPNKLTQGAEAIQTPKEEIYIRTEKGGLKGDLVEERSGERVIRTTWTHDGKGVGDIVTIPAQAEIGKPLKIRIERDGKNYEHETGNVQLAARGEKGTFVTLDELIAQGESKTLSAQVPESEQHTEEEYQKALQPYSCDGTKYAATNPDDAKCDFPNGDESTGWKIHLNVEPTDCSSVADYLTANQYDHKYLQGGLGTEGKAFTIYFGSRAMMKKWASKISEDLLPRLRKPLVQDEADIAPGIVGRFVAGDPRTGDFTQYGDYGLVARKQYVIDKGNWRNITTREAKIDVYTDAYKELTKKFGKYFHG